MNIFIKQPRRVFFVFIISLFSRLCIAAGLGAGFDEAYYYSYSLRPSLSYFDHPPFVGFLAGLFPTIIGIANHFTIRLGAILLFSLAGLMLYQFAKKLVSEDEAFFTYLLFNITPLFSLGAGTMILPDSGLVFFWILSLWILQKLFFKNHDTFSMWILGGLLAGLAMLSKYHGVLLILSLFMYILFYHRKLLISLKPYSYVIISLIVFLPVIIWNLKYNFISF